VVGHLRPEVVVVARDVGVSEVRTSEVDRAIQALGYERVCSELGYGAAVGGGVDKASNLELKGGFAQIRDVLFYELPELASQLGSLPDFKADLAKPKLLRDVLLPLEELPPHVWVDAGAYSAIPRRSRQPGGPIFHMVLTEPGQPLASASRLVFKQGDSRPWIVTAPKTPQAMGNTNTASSPIRLPKSAFFLTLAPFLKSLPVCFAPLMISIAPFVAPYLISFPNFEKNPLPCLLLRMDAV